MLHADEWMEPGKANKYVGPVSRLWRMVWLLILPPQGHRIIPTASGYILILVSLGLGSAAYNAANNILYMALSLMLSTLVLSGFLSWLNFCHLRWRLLLPPHFRVGEQAVIQIEIHNGKRFIPTYGLWFKTQTADGNGGERVCLNERLNADTSIRLNWYHTPQYRGPERLILSGLESQFPFGFLQKRVGGGIQKTIVVLPRRIEYAFDGMQGVRTNFQGEVSARIGSGAEIVNIRQYSQGDAQRLVHWKATARSKKLMVKQMADESLVGYTLFIETPASIWALGEQFETLCSFVASLAEDLFRAGRLLGVAMNSDSIVPIKKMHDLMIFLEQLAELQLVETYTSQANVKGHNVITFKPGDLNKVDAYVGGKKTGTA